MAPVLRVPKTFDLNTDDLKKAALILRAVNHKLRQSLLQYIASKEQTTVTEICKKLKLLQPEASMHLAILRKAGIVKTERNGHFIYYSVDFNRIEQLEKLAALIIKGGLST